MTDRCSWWVGLAAILTLLAACAPVPRVAAAVTGASSGSPALESGLPAVHDDHYGASNAGPIAPLAWVDAVLAYAATVVPLAKTYARLHFYGYDWIGSAGQPLEWR